MRKLLSGLLVLAMLAALLPVTALAAGPARPVEVSGTLENGAVTLVFTAAEETVSGSLTVSYDKEVLTLDEAQVEGDVKNVLPGDGTVTLAYAAGSEHAIGAGERIAQVVLSCADQARATQVTVTLEDFNAREGLHLSLGTLNLDPGLPFTDVPEDAWFYEAVKYTYQKGWIKGMTETIFQPNGSMTRAMFVTLLGRMAGVEEDRNAETGFTDVKAGSYYAGYVAWAAENGIVLGTTQTTFSPNAQVTREQMAAFLYRYAAALGLDTEADVRVLDEFPDSGSISGYAQTAMAWAVTREILIGTGKGLEPKALATRAQGTQVLMRFSLYVG